MAYTSMRNYGFLNGIPIAEMGVTCNRSMAEFYNPSSYERLRAVGPSECSINMRLIIQDDSIDQYAYLESITDLFKHNDRLISLGPGMVCPYCGDYNPAGLAICRRCGGETRKKDLVSIHEFPFHIAEYSIDSPSQDFVTVSLAWVSYSDPIWTFDPTSGELSLFSHGSGLQSVNFDVSLAKRYYICAYCGQTVESGKICSYCGGQRLPWQEVVELRRECIYCGREAKGGIVCKGCAAGLASKTFKMTKGELC